VERLPRFHCKKSFLRILWVPKGSKELCHILQESPLLEICFEDFEVEGGHVELVSDTYLSRFYF
jgi:hypothetical protein